MSARDVKASRVNDPTYINNLQKKKKKHVQFSLPLKDARYHIIEQPSEELPYC